MSRSIRKKEMELYAKWNYLKTLAKDEKLKSREIAKLYLIKDEIYKKCYFYNNYLKAKEKIENEIRKNEK